MRSSRFILLSVFILLCSMNLLGQVDAILKGEVIDRESKLPIAGVDIYCTETGAFVTSDGDGSFEVDVKDDEVNTITFFRQGYNTTTLQVNGNADEEVTVLLEKLSVELTEIQLRAKRIEEFQIKRLKDVDGTSIYAGKKTEVVVMDLLSGNLANNNTRQIYAQVTGLNVYEGSDGGLQLSIGGRGLDPNRTSNFNTRQNGYDISADVLGYPENYYTPPSEAISEIQIIRGASSLQYGTQFGGLINFKLHKVPFYKPLEIKSKQTVGSFGLFNTFNYIGFSKGKLSMNGYYNYKKGDGYRRNSNFTSNSVHLALEYRISDKTKVSSEYTHFNYLAKQAGGLTDTQFEEDARQSTRDRNWFNVNWNLFNFKLEHQLKEDDLLSLNLFGLSASRRSVGYRGNPLALNENPITSLDEQNSSGQYITPRDLIIGDFKNIGAEIRYLKSYKIQNKKAKLLIGTKLYKSENASEQGAGGLLTDADFTFQSELFPDYPAQSSFSLPNTNVALFSENIFYINEDFSITPGIRIEYINTGTDGIYNQVITDNAGNPIANNLFEEKKSLKRSFALLGAGLSYDFKNGMNLYANFSQNYRSVTFSDIRVVSPSFIIDPDISDESGFTFDIGIRGRAKKVFSYEINAFNIQYNDRIGIILNDRANRVRKNIGKASIVGMESLLSLNVDRLLELPSDFGFNAFTNMAWTHSEYIESEENNVVGNRVEFIPTINFKAGIGLGYKNLLFTGQISHISEQYTDVQNSNAELRQTVRSGIIGEIPAYTIMDLSLSYSMKNIKVETGINNVLDRAYFTRRATGYPGPGIIPSEGRSYYMTIGYQL